MHTEVWWVFACFVTIPRAEHRGEVLWFPTTPQPQLFLILRALCSSVWHQTCHVSPAWAGLWSTAHQSLPALRGWQAAATLLRAFFTDNSTISAPGGALWVQQLETSWFLCYFSIFHNCEGETRALPTQPGQEPVDAYTSILPPAKPCPAWASPLLTLGDPDSSCGCLWLNLKMVSTLSVGLASIKAGMCSHCGGNRLKHGSG